MAVLAKCWLIIEAFLIPEGFLKWFYLSFYIHPFFISVCRIFLWLKLLMKCVLFLLFYPCKLVSFVCTYFFKILMNWVVRVFSFARLMTNFTGETTETEHDHDGSELVQVFNTNQNPTWYCNFSSVVPIPGQLNVFQCHEKLICFEEVNCVSKDDDETSGDVDEMESENLCRDEDRSLADDNGSDECIREDHRLDRANGYSSLDSSPESPIPEDLHSNEYPESLSCLDSRALMERQETDYSGGDQEKDVDLFFNKYSERMRWFDKLNYDRTREISEVLNKQIRTPSSTESITEDVEFKDSPYILWGKTDKKKLLRSLENDFDLVYVAQACLSWEALHYEHRKVEALASSTSGNAVFYNNVTGEFQKFQVLLERFMEDERIEGKRVWNYVRERFSFKSLLQVPNVSGYFDQEVEEMNIEAINVGQVLKAIEKCIEAFWGFVKADDKKPWWKLKSPLWTSPPVEDPRDLKLFADLTRQLQKKELWLKDSQGKKRCWFRKMVNPVGRAQKKEMMFTMIDIKLVGRVLQLPMLSSSQLKWCQENLDNIDFEDGKIVRASASGPLFPL